MPPPKGTKNFLEGPGDYSVTKLVYNDTYPAISPLSIPPLQKAVFIVGASRGIGLSMAKSFAQAGASHIAIGARSNLDSVKSTILAAAAEAKRSPPQVLCVEIDIISQKSAEKAAALVTKTFGKLDILLINAGVLGGMASIADSDPEKWWSNWEINVKGPYLVSRAFLPLMLKRGDKTIITTSSVGAHLITPGVSAYQTTKLAVLRLMEFVSTEYKDQGVLAYSIHPGNVLTTLVAGEHGLPEELAHVFTESAELCADTLVYLTKEKRMWLAGRYINCTWDMIDLMEQENEIVKGDKLKVRMVL